MAFLSVNNVKISGIAAVVPTVIKDVRKLPFFSDGEAEKVIALTHVERTRIVRQGQCCSDLCFEAAEKLIDKLNWDRNDVQAIVFVSLSRDYLTPPTSCVLQDRLGLNKECLAFDIPLACSGYVYGLSVLSSMMSGGCIKKALLLVGETTSVQQSPLDKVLWPLHGDGGTATALEYDPSAEPFLFNLCSDGSGADAIIQTGGGTRVPLTPASFEMKEVEPGVVKNELQGKMDGMSVLSFSLKEPANSINALCKQYDIKQSSIDYLLLHQANKYMDDKIVRKLNFPTEKVPFSIAEFGNTSGASIPLTMVTSIGEKLNNSNIHVVMCGFGSGLSWGSAYINLNHILCLPLIEQ